MTFMAGHQALLMIRPSVAVVSYLDFDYSNYNAMRTAHAASGYGFSVAAGSGGTVNYDGYLATFPTDFALGTAYDNPGADGWVPESVGVSPQNYFTAIRSGSLTTTITTPTGVWRSATVKQLFTGGIYNIQLKSTSGSVHSQLVSSDGGAGDFTAVTISLSGGDTGTIEELRFSTSGASAWLFLYDIQFTA